MKYSPLFFILLLMSCATSNETKESPVSYELKTFRLESQGGCKADTLQCAYFEVSYPEFAGLEAEVSRVVSKRIDAAVSLGNPESQGQTMEQIGKIFIQDYDDFKSEIPDAFGGWHYTAKVEVEVLTDSLLSLSVHDEYYTGGAHGGSGVYFINIDPRTGDEFTLENFFKPGYNDALTNLGNKVFRQTRNLADTSSLSENYFEFPEDKFQLNKNYGFTQEGVVFFYNSYEIAPYAAGPTEVVIPYKDVKEWIKG